MRLSQKIFLWLCVAAQTTKNLTKSELSKRAKQDILTMFCSSNINTQYCKNYLLTNNN